MLQPLFEVLFGLLFASRIKSKPLGLTPKIPTTWPQLTSSASSPGQLSTSPVLQPPELNHPSLLTPHTIYPRHVDPGSASARSILPLPRPHHPLPHFPSCSSYNEVLSPPTAGYFELYYDVYFILS